MPSLSKHLWEPLPIINMAKKVIHNKASGGTFILIVILALFAAAVFL